MAEYLSDPLGIPTLVEAPPVLPHAEIDPAMSTDIAKFEAQLARYPAGDLAEDVFASSA